MGKEDVNNCSPPPWMNAAFIQTSLREGGETNVVVEDIKVKFANAVGDHYASEMYRVIARLSDGSTRSVIVKTLPSGEQFRILIQESDVFTVESRMFRELVPRMETLLKRVIPEGVQPFTARCLHRGKEPFDYLVLEDLTSQGFVLGDRLLGLGLRHSLIALRALAKFHAASVILMKQDPSIAQSFPNPFKKSEEGFKTMIIKNFRCLAEEVKNWDVPKTYSEKIKNCAESFYERCTAINYYNPKEFNVILHGDFWVNNMMFRYENNVPVDFRFVDLQISHCASPAIDVIYFLYSSVSEDVSTNHLDLLIREYYFTLDQTLELLGSEDRISFDTFKRHMADCGVYVLFSSLGVLPIVKSSKDKAFDTEASLSNNDNANIHLITAPIYVRWMKRLLPLFDKMGLLDM